MFFSIVLRYGINIGFGWWVIIIIWFKFYNYLWCNALKMLVKVLIFIVFVLLIVRPHFWRKLHQRNIWLLDVLLHPVRANFNKHNIIKSFVTEDNVSIVFFILGSLHFSSTQSFEAASLSSSEKDKILILNWFFMSIFSSIIL